MKLGESFLPEEEKKKVFSIPLSKKQKDILKREAKKRGMSMANYLRLYGLPKERS